jgi:hypothetical protein
MFHWICPECGREIAPTVRECPVCDPIAGTVGTALAGEVEAPARASNVAAEPVLDIAPPAPETQVEAPVVAAGVVLMLAPPVVPRIDPPPVLAACLESPPPLPAQNSPRAPDRGATETPLPQFGIPATGGDPLEHLAAMLDSMEPEPPPATEAIPLPARAAHTVPPSLRAFIAELQPAGAKARIPVTPLQRVQAVPEPPLFTSQIRMPLRSSRPADIHPVGAKLLALPVTSAALVRPWTPQLELAPALAPLGKYNPLAERPLRPALPQTQLLKKECGPRTTLPGPMLTRRLVKFLDLELSAIPPAMLQVKKRLIPGWMASALIIGTLLGAGFTSIISIVRPSADGKQTAVTEVQAAASTSPATAAPSVSASPLANAIEVTGFRIQMEPGKKSEIEYLVVNHTASRFNGVTVYVTLYAIDAKAGQPPLCRFQFAAPNLGPYQSKDMTSAIEQATRPVTLPGWQDLRAAVDIGQ